MMICVAIFATSLLSVLMISHVVRITWDNGYTYIYLNFTSTDVDVDESMGIIVKDISILNSI